jgi:heme exporter protein CcmD
MNDFLHMSGYGLYVWASYAIWFAIVAWNVWSALRMRAEARTRALRRNQAASTADRAPAATHETSELSEEGV